MSSFMSMNDSFLQPRVVSVTPRAGGGGVGGGTGTNTVPFGGAAQQPNQNMASLIKAITQQYGDAKNANLQRYAQALGLTDQMGAKAQSDYQEGTGLTTATAKAEKANLADQTQSQSADLTQRMISSGQGNTTVLPSLQQGIQHQADLSNLAIDANQQNAQLGLLGQRNGTQQNALGQKLNTIVGRSDPAPDLNSILSLVSSSPNAIDPKLFAQLLASSNGGGAGAPAKKGK